MKMSLSILVAEDEPLIAFDIEAELLRAGVDVVGPCHTLDDCLSTIERRDVDAAILDIDLHGEKVFPAAERLQAMGAPIVFQTGRGDLDGQVRRRFPDAAVFSKPVATRDMLETLQAQLGPRSDQA